MLVGKYMSSFIIDPLPLELPELRKEEPRRECKGGGLKEKAKQEEEEEEEKEQREEESREKAGG